MATHSPITNAEIDVDSPVTQALLTKYRENPKADFEGTGTGVSFAALADITPGNIVLDGMQATRPPSTTYSELESFTVYKAGTYRVNLLLLSWSSSHTVYARIYRNGTAVGTARSVTGTAGRLEVSEDIAFSVGDTIEIWGRLSTSAYVGAVAASISAASAYHASIVDATFDLYDMFSGGL